MQSMELHASIHEDDDGARWAEVKEFPGCFAWFESRVARERELRAHGTRIEAELAAKRKTG